MRLRSRRSVSTRRASAPLAVALATLLTMVTMWAVGVAPASAGVAYANHDISMPANWNGIKIYISPGHTTASQNVFPCGRYANSGTASEYKSAWHIGYALRDQLVANGYMVMMPKRLFNGSNEVGLTDRVDTAYDWWSTKTNNRFLYVPVHSNAGPGGCSFAGGTQLLARSSYDNGLDAGVVSGPGRVFNLLSYSSPGSGSAERVVTDRCTNQSYPTTVYEICSSKAKVMRTVYVESDFHSTTRGADWVYDNDSALIPGQIRGGINCYYFGGSPCQ